MEFPEAIAKFNGMYGLPNGTTPDLQAVGDPVVRLLQFGKIMREEMNEGGDIIASLHGNSAKPRDKLDHLTDLCDWLGDIVVYATSEAKRYGIELDPVLKIIMESNFSKLGADGQAIMKDGKVQKGPNYWKPEELIKQYLSKTLGVEHVPFVPFEPAIVG